MARAVALVLLSAGAAEAQISYVQRNFGVPQTPQSVVTVSFTAAQTAGDLNVVAIGWSDSTSQVVNVTDASGNVYVPALAPTVQSGVQSQAIYYAGNIVGAATNAVTVTFSTAVSYPDVRIAEYRGIDLAAPVASAAGASGTGTTSNSGSVTTTVANALLVGANYVTTATTGAGTGFTSRVITSPNGSILEDRIVSAAGTYSATASLASGSWVMQLVAFRGATSGPPDTQAPTSPGSPTATVVSSSRIDLAWPAATDNVGVTGYRVERCQGAGCATFVEVGTPTALSFSSTGLAPASIYTFRVRATDAAGNLGPYSTPVTATTPAASDTQAPTAPTGVIATPVSGSQIDLAWTSATDNVGVTLYRIERCQGANCTSFVEIGTAPSTSYSNTGLATAVLYRYRVRAADAAGNLGPYSTIVGATTPDTQLPTAPGSPVATPLSASRITLAWTAATDNVGVTGYRVERCQGVGCVNFAQVATTTGTLSYNNTGLATGTSYSYRVRATDAAGNLGPYSVVATAVTQDTQAPTAPATLTASPQSSTRIDLTWTAATDNAGVALYRVERCQGSGCTNFVEVGTSLTLGYSNNGLAPSTVYRYRVRAADAAGNLGTYSPVATAQTLTGPDTEAPGAPGNPTAGVVSSTQINVSWSVATDNVGVTSYLIERCQGTGCADFGAIAQSSTTSYGDTGLAPATSYQYRVRASDAAGNVGPYSATVAATTQGLPMLNITQPAQGQTVIGSVVNVAYSVSGDLTEVNHVHFQLDAGPIVMDLSLDGVYQFTGVPTGAHVLAGFLVRVDHSKIDGTDATPVSFTTTPDTQAPTAPGNLVVSAVSSSQIAATWTAATDDAGVTLYRVERCQGQGCATFAEIGTATTTTYSDTGLTASTSYTYRVRASDAAGNTSPFSSTATAVTPNGAPPVPISFVQTAYAVPQSPQSVVTVGFTAPQTSGDLNVVAIGWSNSTSQVVSVTDARGNLYTPALAATVQSGVHSHAIYYAANIVGAPGNTVTVTFSAAVPYPDVRIAEYRGIDTTAPVAGAVGASGTGATSNSGSVATSVSDALLVGANVVSSLTTAAGAGFTSRVITSPNGSILEDRIVSASGTYSATASILSSDWVMQLVVFRGAPGSGPDTVAPTAPANVVATAISGSQIALSWLAATDNVAVTGYLIDRCPGNNCSTFAQIATTTALVLNDTGLTPLTSYSYRVRATDAAGNLGAYSATATASTTNTAAPAAPTALSTAFIDDSRIDLTWTASTSVVSGYLVERCLGASCSNFAQIATTPGTAYSDTGLQASTTYRYRVRAVDAAGAFSAYSAPVTATTLVLSPVHGGQWSAVRAWPNVAIHAAVLPTGKVLAYDIDSSGQGVQVWDPLTDLFAATPYPSANLFCSGLTLLADGRVLVAGGHIDNYVGLKGSRLFNPTTQTWTNSSSMAFGRWYPTLTTLPSGRVLVTSGSIDTHANTANTPELYDPATGIWTQLTNASLALPLYPHVFVLPSGKVLVTGSYEQKTVARTLDVATQTWTTVDPLAVEGGSAAMYLPGKILTSGFGTAGGDDINGTPSASSSYVLDTTLSVPSWRQTASMAFKRDYHTLTLLPDGSVLATGGGQTIGATDASTAVLPAELWSPESETWTTLASMQTPRLYHSIALLLPDARVLVAGGGRNAGVGAPTLAVDRLSSEIYSPPYLFKGPRPVISSAPSVIPYGQAVAVTLQNSSTSIAKVSLVRLGAVTHAINMNQRFVPLTFQQTGGSLTVQAPANANLAPPGDYMLFVLDPAGVPSVASMVKVQ